MDIGRRRTTTSTRGQFAGELERYLGVITGPHGEAMPGAMVKSFTAGHPQGRVDGIRRSYNSTGTGGAWQSLERHRADVARQIGQCGEKPVQRYTQAAVRALIVDVRSICVRHEGKTV